MLTSGLTAESERIDGSFRDPSGYVFRWRGRVFRSIDADCYRALRGVEETGLLDQLMADRVLVPTRFVEDLQERERLEREYGGDRHFLEHEAVPLITYPYEWSVSMLADAAVLTLDLQQQLVQQGYALKDATAYNVQFVDGRPMFIDFGSIEKPGRLDLWYALGQFSRMFTFPLLLARHRGWDLKSYFLSRIGGQSLEEVARCFTWLERLRPRLLLDVTLPLWLGRKGGGSGTGAAMLDRPGTKPTAQLVNLARLRRKVTKLAAGYRLSGMWSRYTTTCTYTDKAEAFKKELIRKFLHTTRPARVLDAGSNTGDYSYLAAECGASVTAVDGDHDAVEQLYRRLRDKPAAITPMVLDLTNPSPGVGLNNRERPGFRERLDADCVFALALLHHLLVTGNLSLAAACDLLASHTSSYLVLEFVPPADPMFQGLLRFRRDRHEELTLEACRAEFGKRFELVEEHALPDSPRTLLFWRKKGN